MAGFYVLLVVVEHQIAVPQHGHIVGINLALQTVDTEGHLTVHHDSSRDLAVESLTVKDVLRPKVSVIYDPRAFLTSHESRALSIVPVVKKIRTDLSLPKASNVTIPTPEATFLEE
jgi:hypothetical protein